MLINELVESEEFWRRVGRRAGRALGRALKPTGSATVAPTRPMPTPAAKDYSQYQTPTVLRRSLPPAAGASAQAQPQAVQAKPRVVSQPIRVGNKVYRPGDPMHARLSQMLQAQRRT